MSGSEPWSIACEATPDLTRCIVSALAFWILDAISFLVYLLLQTIPQAFGGSAILKRFQTARGGVGGGFSLCFVKAINITTLSQLPVGNGEKRTFLRHRITAPGFWVASFWLGDFA